MSSTVEIKNVTKSFGQRIILDKFSLDIKKGEFLAMIGPSGCGKSTILNMIGLLEDFNEGKILLEGKELPRINGRQATQIRRNKINYLFQSYALVTDMTVLENLLLAMHFMPISNKEKVKQADQVLEQVGLLALRGEKVNVLSGGEQQRVAIARTVLKPGDLILADEPTGALDEVTAEKVFALIMNLSKGYGKTVIMVTHSRQLAERADRMVDLRCQY
jgi:putative ABC transport system ATP-binding protein